MSSASSFRRYSRRSGCPRLAVAELTHGLTSRTSSLDSKQDICSTFVGRRNSTLVLANNLSGAAQVYRGPSDAALDLRRERGVLDAMLRNHQYKLRFCARERLEGDLPRDYCRRV